jgi:hypothetical protein
MFQYSRACPFRCRAQICAKANALSRRDFRAALSAAVELQDSVEADGGESDSSYGVKWWLAALISAQCRSSAEVGSVTVTFRPSAILNGLCPTLCAVRRSSIVV